MIILPAIDLKDGKVVRLYQGDFDTVHQVADDPVETACVFLDAGARYIHMVDLDGAKDGVRKNADIVRAVAETGLKVELGGGIRSMDDLKSVFDMGIFRAVIGSAAVSDPEFVKRAVEVYGSDRIAVGIDARQGIVQTAGWTKDSGIDYLDLAKRMISIGVKYIIFTDIDLDGTLQGPAYERLMALKNTPDCAVIASGGVACNEDIAALRDMEMYGVIIGKAFYAGTVDIARAVQEGGPQC